MDIVGDEQFLRPDYAKYSFAQIPSLVEILLGTKEGEHPLADMVLSCVNSKPQNVILLMIDGFGYNQWLKYGEQYPFLSRNDNGIMGSATINSIFRLENWVS